MGAVDERVGNDSDVIFLKCKLSTFDSVPPKLCKIPTHYYHFIRHTTHEHIVNFSSYVENWDFQHLIHNTVLSLVTGYV